eukprot:899433_1
MTQLFESSNTKDPITNLVNRKSTNWTDINQRVKSYYKCEETKPNWSKIIQSKRNKEINDFFDKHESSMLCSGSWYLKALISTNNLESLHYVLSKTKSFHINNPFTYCITNQYRNFTPIQYACCVSNFDTIKLLLNKGSDVTHESNHRIINLLLEHNTCMDELNIIPCIHHIVSCGCRVPKDSIYYLTRHYQSHEPLQGCETYFDIVSLAQYLATHGADMNYIGTALDRGYFDLAQMMIDEGAHLDDNLLRYITNKQSFIWLFGNNYVKNIDYNNKYKGTALFYHTEQNHYDAVEVLVSYGADVNVRCKYSKLTAIEVAMFSGFDRLVTLLYKPTLYERTPALLANIKENKFEALPTDPGRLKNLLIEYHEEKESKQSVILDAEASSEIDTKYQIIEANITDLLKKLAVKYDELLKIQCVRNKVKYGMNYNRNRLKMWDDFEALWIYWDIESFVEWLKRIPNVSHVKYWKDDKECMDRVVHYIESNPKRFGVNDTDPPVSLFRCNDMDQPVIITPPKKRNKTKRAARSDPRLVASKRRSFLDGLNLGSSSARSYKELEEKEIVEKRTVFKGEYLEYFDRYVLSQIGVSNEGDLDIVFNELMRLKRKYPLVHKQIENENGNVKENRGCDVCCEREITHILECGHPFCEFCIDEFRKTTNRCAICKAKISLVIKMY